MPYAMALHPGSYCIVPLSSRVWYILELCYVCISSVAKICQQYYSFTQRDGSGCPVASGNMFLLLLKFTGGKLFSVFIELLDLCHRGCLVWQVDLSLCTMFS